MSLVDTDHDTGIGFEGARLSEMLDHSESLFAQTGHYHGLRDLTLKTGDPIGFEQLFSRLRSGLVSARSVAMNISASPIVKELGELCFALYTPEGDSIALSTGIIVHVHTMSDALKFMVRSEYEENPGIRPGDIFANNQPTIGDVHNADVQTFVPIFHEGELIAWAGGVNHVIDIGSPYPGNEPWEPTNRRADGIDLPCMKIGERDELARWHLKRVELQSRAPYYWILDERCRLAGCHMIRSAVERLIAEEGVDRFRQFSREVIEEGRRSTKSRVREMTVPGRYRAPAFAEVTSAGKAALPRRSQRDFMMHAALEVRIDDDGDFALDFDGTSAWGRHSMNCTPSAMQGAIWVQFTQTLICNDKVNDGAYLALETNFPEGTVANLGDAEGSTSTAWGFLIPAFTGFPRTLSRALQSRGFIEEIASAYSTSGSVLMGGGEDQYGQESSIQNFESAAQGMGAKYVLDGTDYAGAMWNPEGDMGDVEMWELVAPLIYLGRRIKANTAGPGRHRGGSSAESLFMANKTPFYELMHGMGGKAFHSAGLFGGYPGSCAYIHDIHGADLLERAARGEAYPVRDGSFDEPELLAVSGERTYLQDFVTLLEPVQSGDLYLTVMKGGAGLGDVLLRTPASVAEDVRGGHLLADYAASIYGVVLGDDLAVDEQATAGLRAELRDRRLVRTIPVSEWWKAERERVRRSDLRQPIKDFLAESMKLSPRWAAEFRGFWDLPEDFELEGAETPTLAIEHAAPGRVTPEAAADEYLAAAHAFTPAAPAIPVTGHMNETTLGMLLDEKLPRRDVKDIQSGYKDPDRFDLWLRALQDRVGYSDPIVLPVGEGLNVVRPASGELAIRCDCGHDFCAPDRNWKMHAAIFVRDDEASLRELYPKMAHCDPDWMHLREYVCPSCARLLEVEAVPPGYPVVFDFLPDIEGFYRGWLGRQVP
jgi:N-methylhydantoinase B/oxoprolinase/acetone carboxylase alpha subunit/acetone carboxylase gamma subunit